MYIYSKQFCIKQCHVYLKIRTRLKAPIESAPDAAYSLIICKTFIILIAQWYTWLLISWSSLLWFSVCFITKNVHMEYQGKVVMKSTTNWPWNIEFIYSGLIFYSTTAKEKAVSYVVLSIYLCLYVPPYLPLNLLNWF